MVVESKELQGPISSLVNRIWYIEFDANEEVNRSDTIIPMGYSNVVFNFSDPYYLIGDEVVEIELPQILITGQLDRIYSLRYGNRLRQLGLIIPPSGFLAIFGKSSILYKNLYVEGNEHRWDLRPLYRKLAEVKDFESMLPIIEEYFIGYLSAREELKPLDTMITRIEESGGTTRISELAASLNYSNSAFERYFKRHTGIAPKAYANLVRFRHSMTKFDNMEEVFDLYYDQPHFIRTCRKYTGKTPSELLVGSDEISFQCILDQR